MWLGVCGESSCRDVYFSYIVHIILFTQSHYGDELPSRDKVMVKGLVVAPETGEKSFQSMHS